MAGFIAVESSNSATTVKAVGLTHRYNGTVALDAASLTVGAGEIIGVVGPDGVGKSTLLALIAGVRRIQSGYITVLGGDLASERERRMVYAGIAYMPQGLGQNLYPSLSIYENLDFFARLYGISDTERHGRIEELLEATGLAPFPDRAMGKLSGGMKQKLGLCAALIHDPDILILDEPTTGVDPLSRRQFWTLISEIRRRRPHMSVIVATAYMEEAEPFDRLIAMDSGRILATDTPEALKANTGTRSLDDAFVALLPPSRRGTQNGFTIPPPTEFDDTLSIEAVNLTRRFGDFTAVDDVSFAIPKGEIFGFVGSNGCGKTTTMKMLTGLLAPTSGEALLFGKQLDASDMRTRQRVGYMSQSFSLYRELSVFQNLVLHARLFHVPAAEREDRVQQMMTRFDLGAVANDLPDRLPLGLRQRLSLAIALIHGPELLILDEPTSGVDPVGRDAFWRYLIQLSREDGVTIFITTHYMSEAERCDRVSLMHEGKVLALGTPSELKDSFAVDSLEEAFVQCLRGTSSQTDEPASDLSLGTAERHIVGNAHHESAFDITRLWAYGRREAMELLRDRIRLAFALLGPLLLLVTFSYGISFDIENMDFAVLDLDRTPQSRELIASFEGSRYFQRQADLGNTNDIARRLRSGELLLAIEVPPGFGEDFIRNNGSEVGVWLDGAIPFRAESARGYVRGVIEAYLRDQGVQSIDGGPTSTPFEIEPRFRYNQSFRSISAMAPSTIMLLMIMIPAMMTAVGVVREKELGSITNLYATPVTRLEFLLGKQFPYIVLALVSFTSLILLQVTLFQVPVKGSLLSLGLGALAFVAATTGFGLLISTFVNSQIAAIFAASILSVISTINFSGFFQPVSALQGMPRVMAVTFPANYFQKISVGTSTKGLGLGELWPNHLALAGFAAVFLIAALLLLRKQET